MIDHVRHSIYRKEPDLEQDIINLDLGLAESLDLKNIGNASKLFISSGLKYILKEVRSRLENHNALDRLEHLFIETSLFTSSIETNKLAAFTCTWDRNKTKEHSSLQSNVSQRFSHIISKLQHENLALLWHPDFSYETNSAVALQSKIDKFKDLSVDDLNYYNLYNVANVKNGKTIPLAKISDHEFEGDVHVTNSLIDFEYSDFKSPDKRNFYKANRDKGDLHTLNHYLYHKNFLSNENKDNLKSYFISIPILGSSSSSADIDYHEKGRALNFKGQGAVFLFFTLRGESDLPSLRTVISELCIQIPRVIKDSTPDYLFNTGFRLITKARAQAMNSAKAAIMGRNMSHNIGSHVLYYLKGHLSSVTQMVRDQVVLEDLLYTVVNHKNEEYIELNEEQRKIKSIQLPFLKGLGRFLTYLQERQDFIATIASSYHPSMVSVNFKDFIIDNFMADKRAERHGAELKRENNILLQYLAKSEDINVEIFLNGKSLSSSESIDDDLRNIEVDVPGGVLGRQAFYSILENIIRNAAKHGKPVDGHSLILDIRINSINENYYKISIIDNNVRSGENAEKVDAMLDEDLIDEQLKLIEHHKGIKEIKISALWLLGKSLININKEKRTKYIKIISEDKQLTYEFYLYKSQKLAILSDEGSFLNIEKSTSYKFFDLENESDKIFNKIKKFNLVVNTTSEKYEGLQKKLKRYVHSMGLLNKPSKLWYSIAYLGFLEKCYPELNDTPPIICTDQLESKGNSQKLNVKNEELKKWIENDGLSFVKTNDQNPIFYKPVNTGNKRIAFKRHFKEQSELRSFFGEDFHPDQFHSFIEKKKHVKKLIGIALESYYSIESITGDNSTIRILYNEEKNDEWILKCVETALSKILILDERLWNYSCFYIPSRQDKNTTRILKTIDELIKDTRVFKFNHIEFYDKLKFKGKISDLKDKEFRKLVESYDMDSIVDDSNPFLYTDFKKDLERIFVPDSEAKEKYNIYTPTSFELNGISICNIDQFSDGELVLIDLFRDQMLTISNILDADNIEVSLSQSKNVFNYLSIHQGILDKIYNYYVELVKDAKLPEVEVLTKEDYIPLLINAFQNCINPNKFSIHSGRSRPYILPQGVSFIPFSGIEYGINESKQVLLNIILSAENEGFK